jgi:TatD DNase family protein
MYFIDSHCHLDFPEFQEQLPAILDRMNANHVSHALCIGVNLEDSHRVLDLAASHPHLYATVGVHPDYEDVIEPSVDQLCALAQHPKVLAIGETGLDYYRLTGDLEWQRDRFRTHIRAAKVLSKPLIVHTRQASEDTIRLLKEEHAEEVGGVLHCFTESLPMAQQAIELGFYISFSGILTFKKAQELRETARQLPLDRLLIETDSPYLAPTPHRGARNEPSYVRFVAQALAELKNIPIEIVAEATTHNFNRLFGVSL